ncbi:hypothetical protein ACQPYH_18255 [Kribbella sp. CA-245084]|uniref:hypothetical protein n=1 Tax=Kribbella sp. CA-245084 TaxID=3239940 RepID=UPI003D904F9B
MQAECEDRVCDDLLGPMQLVANGCDDEAERSRRQFEIADIAEAGAREVEQRGGCVDPAGMDASGRKAIVRAELFEHAHE